MTSPAYQKIVDHYRKVGPTLARRRSSGSQAYWDGFDGVPNLKYPAMSINAGAYRAGVLNRKAEEH